MELEIYDWYLEGFAIAKGASSPNSDEVEMSTEDRAAFALGLEDGSNKHSVIRTRLDLEKAVMNLATPAPRFFCMNPEECRRVLSFIDGYMPRPFTDGPVTTRLRTFLARL